MEVNFLLKKFQQSPESPAVISSDNIITFRDLSKKIKRNLVLLHDHFIQEGEVVALIGDFSAGSISMLISLILNNNIILPLTSVAHVKNDIKLKIAMAEKLILLNEEDSFIFSESKIVANHDYYSQLRKMNVPGLVLFTSGTSGEPKAAVHNFSLLLKKFEKPRMSLRTLNFLLFDHWGGLNTLFHTLSNNGTVITINDRRPKHVCETIEQYKVELLPATPTFLNLLLISEAYKQFDLSSLKIISYGTEPMPESTLRRLRDIFPDVVLQQTYGLIELGVLRSKSKSNDSLWVKIGGEGFDVRVDKGILQIKAETAMLGYLNANSPFTEDGYFITGDVVEVNNDYFKILGRKSELINVGGEKVYPAEVESLLQRYNNIKDVIVYPESNPITGEIVCAKVSLIKSVESKKSFINELKKFCIESLPPYQVPVKIQVVDDIPLGERFKKIRKDY